MLRHAHTLAVALALAVALGGSAVLARVVASSSFFVHDDYGTFLLSLGSHDLLRYALEPIDVHVVPLHRLVAAAVFRAWGLDYAPAVFVLWGFHALGCAYAFAALSSLVPRTLAASLTAVQAVCPLVVAPLGYFSAGVHRFPAALAVYAASHHYLRFAQGRGAMHALGCVAALAFGLGFFVKTALVPLTLLGLTVTLGLASRRALGLLASLGVVAGAHLVAMRALWPEGTIDGAVGLALMRDLVAPAAEIFVRALALDAEELVPQPTWGMLGPAAAVAAALVALAPRNAITLAAFVALWLVHWTVIAASPRGQWFGEFVLSALRYQFELLPLFTLLLGAALYLVLARRPAARRALDAPLVAGALAVATLAYGVSAVRQGTELAASSRYDEVRRTRDYVGRLRASLDRIPKRQRRGLRIAPGALPPYVLGLYTPRYGDLRKFLRLFGVRASYDRPHRYALTPRGEVGPRRVIERRARRRGRR